MPPKLPDIIHMRHHANAQNGLWHPVAAGLRRVGDKVLAMPCFAQLCSDGFIHGSPLILRYIGILDNLSDLGAWHFVVGISAVPTPLCDAACLICMPFFTATHCKPVISVEQFKVLRWFAESPKHQPVCELCLFPIPLSTWKIILSEYSGPFLREYPRLRSRATL